MGSFNETCGVSGLPIAWRTPCRLFVLRPHWYLPLHYQSEWEPLAIVPLKGVYDDYGKLKDIEATPAFMLQHRILLGAAQEFSDETRKRHHEIFKRYPDDPSALYELCERGVLDVRTPHGVRTTAPFYVREDVYQHVVEITSKAENWHGPFLEHAEEVVDSRFKCRALDEETFGLYREDATEKDKARRGELISQKVELEDLDNGHGRHLGRMMLIEPWARIQDDPELRRELRQAMIDFELFAAGIESVHASWRPTLVRGQESDYDFHAEWHRTLARLADEAQRRWEEE